MLMKLQNLPAWDTIPSEVTSKILSACLNNILGILCSLPVNQKHHVRIMAWVRLNLVPRISHGESGNQIGFNKLDFPLLKLNTENI